MSRQPLPMAETPFSDMVTVGRDRQISIREERVQPPELKPWPKMPKVKVAYNTQTGKPVYADARSVSTIHCPQCNEELYLCYLDRPSVRYGRFCPHCGRDLRKDITFAEKLAHTVRWSGHRTTMARYALGIIDKR